MTAEARGEGSQRAAGAEGAQRAETAQPLISVVIPVYNRATLVERTLESVYAQSFTDYEIVAMNDGSTDDSLEVLRRHEPRVRVYSQENQGLAATRNRGAERAAGKYVTFLDSDDLLFPWSLASYAEAIVQTGEPAFVSGVYVPFSEESGLERYSAGRVQLRTWEDYLRTRAVETSVGPSAALVRRDVYFRCGGSSEVRCMFEDTDLWLRIGAERGYVHIDEPVMAGYRVGHASMMGNMKNTLDGFRWIKGRVERGEYPSGTARKREMEDILATHARGASFRALRGGDRERAWAFYKESLGWNLRLGRLRYALGFPLTAMTGAGRKRVAEREVRAFEGRRA